jgi:hypothetical protein
MEVIALVIIFGVAVFFEMYLFGRFALTNIEYHCEFSTQEAHEGDEIFLVETIYNRKLLPVPWLKVDIHSSRWLDFAGTCSVIAQDSRRVTSSFILKGYQRITRRWKLKCLKRGVFTTENVTLVSGDLLNLNVTSIPSRVDASLMVYPEVIRIEDIFTPVNYLQGDSVVRRWIIDDPFIVSGAREYTPGDPLNRIHWPATAKAGKLMVKSNDYTSQHSLTILLNMQSKLYEYVDVVDRNIIELGIKVAATLLDKALRMGAPVRFGTNGCTMDDMTQTIFTDAASHRQHVGSLMKVLARLAMKNVKDFEIFLEEKMLDITLSDVIIVTSYLSKNLCEQMKLLEESGNTVGVMLLEESYEVGALPGDLDICVMSEEYVNNKRKGKDYDI